MRYAGPCRRWGLLSACTLLVVLAGALCPSRTAAESLLLNPPSGWNGIMFSGSVSAGWRQRGTDSAFFTRSSSFLLAGPSNPPLTPGQVLTVAPVFAGMLPTAGDAKDTAHVTLGYSVTVGAAGPGGSDTFNLAFSGETSALRALVPFDGSPEPADAFIAVAMKLIIPSPVPAATFASIGLPALPLLSAPPPNVESLSATLKVGPYGAPTTVITLGPGSSALTLPLVLDPATTDMLEYTLTYKLLTPYGTDPSVSFSLEGSMERSSVPEIGLMRAPIALLGALAGLIDSRSRRPRAARPSWRC